MTDPQEQARRALVWLAATAIVLVIFALAVAAAGGSIWLVIGLMVVLVPVLVTLLLRWIERP